VTNGLSSSHCNASSASDGLFCFHLLNPIPMKNPLGPLQARIAMILRATPCRIAVLILFLILTSQIGYSQTVYVTRTGAKYHNDGCRYLSRSKISTTIQDAKESGYTACSVCKPSSTVKPSTQKVTSTPAPAPVRKATSTQCTGMTKANKRCLRMTTSANGRCYQH
jgi:hypothetical protein